MTPQLADGLLPASARSRASRHVRRHGGDLRRFRLDVQAKFVAEIDRMAREFIDGSLSDQAAPVVEALRSYTSWLGWCVWCCSHLAPPLGLTGSLDAQRLSAAMVVYCGPRLIDDAIDDHASYKGLEQTVLGRIRTAFPTHAPGELRAQAALIGAWVIIYGLRRLGRHGGGEALQRTLALCEQVAPGAVIESLHVAPLSWEQRLRIVHRKAVAYDQILYAATVQTAAEPVRREVMAVAARISALAQHLNDFGDRIEDSDQRRSNLAAAFADQAAFWSFCREEARGVVAALEALPADLGDALCACLIDTVDASARMRVASPAPVQTEPMDERPR